MSKDGYSKDGYNYGDFHRCCDNKGETLLLFG